MSIFKGKDIASGNVWICEEFQDKYESMLKEDYFEKHGIPIEHDQTSMWQINKKPESECPSYFGICCCSICGGEDFHVFNAQDCVLIKCVKCMTECKITEMRW